MMDIKEAMEVRGDVDFEVEHIGNLLCDINHVLGRAKDPVPVDFEEMVLIGEQIKAASTRIMRYAERIYLKEE